MTQRCRAHKKEGISGWYVSKSMWDRGATGESCPPDSIAPFPWRNPEDTTVTEILGIEGLPTQIGLVSVSVHLSLPP